MAKEFYVSSLIINIGKTSTVKDLNKHEIYKIFQKRKVFGYKQSYSKGDIIPLNTGISRLAGHILSAEIVLPRVIYQNFQRLR